MQTPRIRFKPAELKARHDGWTANRQLHFIQVLDATKSIIKECSAVGMTAQAPTSFAIVRMQCISALRGTQPRAPISRNGFESPSGG